MSTLKVNTVLSADTPTVNITDGLNVTGVSTVATLNTTNIVNSTPLSNRNIVINGAMEVDQRNGGSAVTSSPGGTLNFAADRNHFYNYGTGELTATLQRVADAPAGTGLYNSNKVTITTPESTGGTPGSDDRFSMQHRIEGRDANRLALGTSGAKAFVVSFYVKASIAGDYGLAITNDTGGRSYCMLYPATTSWSRVVLKVPGDTSGTYQAGTEYAFALKFGLYNGSNRVGADQGITGTGSWQATAAPQGTSGQTQLGGTNGATWQITGLQVEVGSEATPFEHRNHADEIARCQRYYFRFTASTSGTHIAMGHQMTSSAAKIILPFPTSMRTRPTAVETTGTATDYSVARTSTYEVCNVVPTFAGASKEVGNVNTNQTQASLATTLPVALRAKSTDFYLGFSAEF